MNEGLPVKMIYAKDPQGREHNFLELVADQGSMVVSLTLKGYSDICYLFEGADLFYLG